MEFLIEGIMALTWQQVVMYVVGVVLIAGVIIYLVRFRKRKAKN